MSSAVLDASALLSLLNREPGNERVAQAVTDGAAMSTANLSEVVARLADHGVPAPDIRRTLDRLNLDLIAFDPDLAYRAGLLRPVTRARPLLWRPSLSCDSPASGLAGPHRRPDLGESIGRGTDQRHPLTESP